MLSDRDEGTSKMKKSVRRQYLITAGIGAVLMGGMTAFAADDLQSFSLDPMVVTATRTQKSVLETPANTQVITGEEIKNSGYSSVFEAVRNLGQMNAHAYTPDGEDYGGMTSRIRMRGIDNGTLVLVNGNPSNFMNSSALTNIPMDQIDRIEIVKGSGSVLYGPQAMGGVVNVITKRPQKTGKVSGSVYGSMGYDTQAGLTLQTDYFNLGMKKSWKQDFYNANDPGSTGNGTTAINLRDRESQQLYADVAVTDDLLFSYGHVKSSLKYQTGIYKDWESIINKLGIFDTTYNNYALVYDNAETGWKANLGYNTMKKDNVYDKSYPAKSSDGTYDGYNFNLDVQKTLLLNDRSDTLVLGGNVTRESLENQSGSTLNKNGRNSYSLYQSWDVNPTEKWEFILGLREYYLSSSSYQDSDFQLLPQVQGRYKINEKSNYYFNVGKSFMQPSISQFFYYFGSNNGVINTDLKPQQGWSYEVGYKYEDDIRSLSADIFYMDVKDKFFWDKTEDDKNIMRNRDKWENTGLEINYSQKLSSAWSAVAGLTVQNPKAESDGKWEQDTARYIVNAGLNYHKSKFMADARLFAYLDREDAYYNREHNSSKIKDHQLKNSLDMTITLSYQPTDLDTFRLVGRNIFDREDVLNNYEYYVPGANVTFMYERKF